MLLSFTNATDGIIAQYGALGCLFVLVCFAVIKLFLIAQKNANTWQEMAIDMKENYIEICKDNIRISEKLTDAQIRAEESNKENFQNVNTKLDNLPQEVIKEIKLLEKR